MTVVTLPGGVPDQDPPDLETIPNFPALEKWIAKLQSWCKTARKELEEKDKEIEGLQDKAQEQERDLEEAKAALAEIETVREMVDDIERGIRTYDELKDYLRVVEP